MGGLAEDHYLGSEILGSLTRSVNHFHQPLRSWNNAGFLRTSEASVRWAQNPTQSPGGRASWLDARAAFHRALTTANLGERQQAFADAFRILGQVMHLVADMASVPHTRDDSHLLGDGFERFMGDRRNAGLIGGFARPAPSLVRSATGDAIARVPIARLWDSDRYDGTNPPDTVTGALFGLSEFTSANFFSDDTMAPRAFANPELPLPALDRLVPGPIEVYPPTGSRRQYLTKTGDGVPVTHMVAEGLFSRVTPPFVTRHVLDDLVYGDYAAHLLPRAIGYASALVDYFFRGRIEIAPPDRHVYGLTTFREGNAGAFTRLRFKVRNVSVLGSDRTLPEDVPAGQAGELRAVVQYRTAAGVNLLLHPEADLSAAVFAVSAPQTVALTRDFTELNFDFSDSPIPVNAADVFLTVVYRGPLGLEQDAVAVGGKDLFEPDSIPVVNATDYDCFNGSPRHVSDFAQFPPFDPSLPFNPSSPQPRDVNGDGQQDLFGPDDELGGIFIKSASFFAAPSPSESQFDFQLPQRTSAQYIRYSVLQDQPFYTVAWRIGRAVDRGNTQTPTFPNLVVGVPVDANVNRLILLPDGSVAHLFRSSFTYRGLTTTDIVLFLAIPGRFVQCLGSSFTLSPDLMRIDGTLAAP
ncbi:MAG: hypothetical protein AUH29_09620 [Candidatus Rokubacteria bacterium 13_1_40CM_69_27]|nr:MAG: hypothetical protein AUH29_09620 [Candidatus Rokubacteria bacterium 13_1_40CM_69_27]